MKGSPELLLVKKRCRPEGASSPMAIQLRDQPQPATGFLKETLIVVASTVLPLGLVIYGMSSVEYTAFYGTLNVDPNEVGMNYATTLSHATGLITFLSFALGVLYYPYYRSRARRRASTTRRNIYIIGGLILLALVTIELGILAALDAKAVRSGKAVGTYGPSVFPLLSYRATPVMIEAAGKFGDAPAIERLESRRLLYLGQANGIAVVYDSCEKTAVYVPMTSALLHVERPPAPRSKQPIPACPP
jgi:hypothetical protein